LAAGTADAVVAEAQRLGLERITGDLRRSVQQSLRFNLKRRDTVTVGGTRFGGEPDLSPDVEWPTWRDRPLIFIAQIALRDLVGAAAARHLPEDGLLSFWYAGAEEAWGFDPAESGAARAQLLPPDAELAPRSTPPGSSNEGPLSNCAWSPRPELTIPPWESSTVDGWALSKEERERYFDLQDWLGLGEGPSVHRLLGHPDPIQGDMQLECQLVTNGLYCGDSTGYDDPRRTALQSGARDWRLLLQVDSDAELGSEWGDSGRVCFWILEHDLAACRFDRTWHIMQCS
jgi:uncharacterized protein YwqG